MVGLYSALIMSKRVDKSSNIQPNTNTVESNANTCVCCGEVIPEGRQVCPNCENEAVSKKREDKIC